MLTFEELKYSRFCLRGYLLSQFKAAAHLTIRDINVGKPRCDLIIARDGYLQPHEDEY